MFTNTPQTQHYIVGGGITGLATAVFLVRDAGVKGEDLHIYEQLEVTGGSLDGAGNVKDGYGDASVAVQVSFV